MLGHLTDEQMVELLQQSALGRLGCTNGESTYIVPLNYIYHQGALIMHSHPGTKIQMMRQNPRVCFEVEELKSFNDWKTVVVQGHFEEVEDHEEQEAIAHSFVNSFMRIKPSDTALLPELTPRRLHPRTGPLKTIIYRVVIDSMSGRYETPEE